jgi:choline-sulfatase
MTPAQPIRRALAIGPLIGLLGALGLACGCDRERPEPGADAPLNVVLVTMDTTRADALGCYGQALPSSPHLDGLAAEGVRFAQVVTSSPSTLPSHATILTGKQPYAHGARSNSAYVVAESNLTLAEVFRQHGYSTGAEIAAQVIGSRTHLDQGFDHYRDLDDFDIERKTVPTGDPDRPDRLELPERPAEDITRRGIEFLRAHRDRPFFLWLHYYDPHRWHFPPERFLRRIPDSPYHAEILYVDDGIGRIASEITRLGMRGRTLLLVTADHGEGNGEHGEETHSYFVYDTTMRVPLILWGADLLPRGRVVQPLVRTVDIAPTLVDLAGLPPLPDVQGVSLRPLLAAGAPDPMLTGYGESIEHLVTFGTSILRFVRQGRWKYIHKVHPELFDVVDDPGELHDLAGQHPETVERLRARLRELVAAAPPRAEGAEVVMDEERLAQLAALGYVGSTGAPEIGDEVAALAVEGTDPASLTREIQQVAEAYGYMKSERFEEAVAILRPLREAYPQSTVLIYALISSLNRLERYDEAIPLLHEAIRLDPDFPNFYLLLAGMNEERGNVAEAETLTRTALGLDPCGIAPRVRYANLLGSQQRFTEQLAVLQEGIEQCEKASATAFRNDYAYLRATCADERIRDGAEALRIAREVAAVGGAAHPSYLDTLAAAYAEVGDFANAVEASRRAIALLRNRDVSDESIEPFARNLALYEAGQPVREP